MNVEIPQKKLVKLAKKRRRDDRGMLREQSPADFWCRVDKSGECWIWTGRTNEDGYGRVGFGGRQNVGAHRVAWELTSGAIPDGQWVLHSCDRPVCVRPSHLFLGNATDNNRDRQSKGRTRGWAGRAGPAHHAFRCDETLTRRVLELRAAGATQLAISEQVGVSRGHISKILGGAQ